MEWDGMEWNGTGVDEWMGGDEMKADEEMRYPGGLMRIGFGWIRLGFCGVRVGYDIVEGVGCCLLLLLLLLLPPLLLLHVLTLLLLLLLLPTLATTNWH
jgi:hypothetical protein